MEKFAQMHQYATQKQFPLTDRQLCPGSTPGLRTPSAASTQNALMSTTTQAPDIEQLRENAVASPVTNQAQDGYPKLARFMSSYPDNAIFRRFRELNLLNLLRLQAEINEMEHQLESIRQEDIESEDLIQRSYTKDFRAMRDNEESGDNEQYEQLLNIGQKLQEYNAALTLALQLKGADQPTDGELRNLQEWLNRARGGNGFLMGEEAKVWKEKDSSEFVTLFPRHLEDDAFTSFLNGRLLDIYNALWGHKRKRHQDPNSDVSDVRVYSESRIARVSNIFGAIISSILPTLVILVLYYVKRMVVRIGLVIVFTAIFSLSLAVFTAARKVEIFSATAAFAAVEVVFIGSSNSTG